MKGEYDVCVRPPNDAEWQDEACKCYKMSTTDAYIMNAKFILEVQSEFKKIVESYLNRGRNIGIFLAWNGKASDCSKLFEVTEVLHRGECEMPRWVKYFADPMKAMTQ